MSLEEQACLVRARSDSENSGRNLAGFGTMAYSEGHPSESGGGLMMSEGNGGGGAGGQAPSAAIIASGDDGTGELIDYGDMSVLAQFHEDAIRQAGCGKHQLLLGGVFGLALAASGFEYAAVPYVLPSADVEFCMTTRQKWWLSSITLLGISCGSMVWGNLADRMGRRRTLFSCLGVNAVFSVIASLMPTYGPFMMARFCSGIGMGGAPVSAIGCLAESCHGSGRRAPVVAALLACAALGAVASAGIASLALPHTGRDTVLENKEHFSAWHRYLLLCAVPTMVTLAGLVWAHESPRYLLECGREVEALMIYQRIYKKNRTRSSGGGVIGGGGGSSGGGGGYQLSELELPSKRPPAPIPPPRSTLADMAFSVHQFWNSFLQLFSSPFASTTSILAAVLSATLFCHFAISAYAPDLIVRNKNAIFQASTERISGKTFDSVLFNATTIENVIYENSTFANCTFKDVTFSHVVFRSCEFHDVEFTNIMSSLTFFEDSRFFGTRFIDTDLNTARHMDSKCRLINSTILGLSPVCPLETDHNIYLQEGLKSRAIASGAAFLGFLIGGILVSLIGRVPVTVGSLVLASLSTPGLYFLETETSIIVFSAIFIGFISMAYLGVTISIIESYPVNLRCTAHGFLFSLAHIAALFAVGIYSNFTLNSYVLATLMTGFIVVVGTAFSTRIVDNSANLM